MKTARDLILELYKEDHIAWTQLISGYNFYTHAIYRLDKYEQPKWTITSNTNNTNVE